MCNLLHSVESFFCSALKEGKEMLNVTVGFFWEGEESIR